MGELCVELGDYVSALEWYNQALAIREGVLGFGHPSTAITYNGLAMVYSAQGDYAKALEYFEKALAISEKVLGLEHPTTVAVRKNMQHTASLVT
jgi:pentatricopeptide repeat protein